MASRDGGGGGSSRDNPIELSSDSDSASESSFPREGARLGPGGDDHDRGSDQPHAVCRFRNELFHDGECERYFDCPGHTVWREPIDLDLAEREAAAERAVMAQYQPASPDVEISSSPDHAEPRDASPISSHPRGQSGEASVPPTVVERGPTPPPRDREPGTAGNPLLIPSSPVASRDDDQRQPVAARNTFRRDGDSDVLLDLRAGIIVRDLRAQRQPIQGPAAPEFTLPRWQPDAEVTYCPICLTQFSIFVRKHHCRKCGRVVCNACSPHRITIPYQYIVQPPWVQPSLPRYPPSFLADGTLDFQSQFGGERVRLCNPCVPDPNITPPQAQGGHSRSQSGLGMSAGPSNRWSSYFGGDTQSDAHVRSRSATMVPRLGSSSQSSAPAYNQRPIEDRILSGTPPVSGYYPGNNSSATQAEANALRASANAAQFDRLARRGVLTHHLAQRLSSQLPPLPGQQPLPPLPGSHQQSQSRPPPIAEEDECPVCHRELPARSLQNYETLREAHITSCITSHSSYSGGAGPSSGGGGGTVAPRRTGMFPYIATEKDCVDSAECSICLEEFEVGVGMARLECLCRFHRACIDAWWERHPGRCPMHQHEDFGY
ncbi:FYVE zinc finger-domain-containing protein [Echria macrotheca]|uniref:RING-type E3 ubiquitin transferase n=1 Tax=Echria macrotheca TaxID=438768 RepID=A0AAJ0B912_9PEZI|nr:FYVE zinc finger-domain-containing protein [Echria macrotheca]